MQFNKANSTLTCTPNQPGVPNSLVANGTQTPGHYFMLGVTPLADDNRYDLQSAALQTTPGTFVAPSNATLQAAIALLQPDQSSGTWPIPYGQFSSALGAAAYPGTMVVYAAVPTSGLPAGDAADYAALLTFAAGPGQTPGEGVGQIPPGYLPITAANGLGGLAAYTLAAAADVAAQNGQVPPLTPPSGGIRRFGFFHRRAARRRRAQVHSGAMRSSSMPFWDPRRPCHGPEFGSRQGRSRQGSGSKDRLSSVTQPRRHRVVGPGLPVGILVAMALDRHSHCRHHPLPRSPPPTMVIGDVSAPPEEVDESVPDAVASAVAEPDVASSEGKDPEATKPTNREVRRRRDRRNRQTGHPAVGRALRRNRHGLPWCVRLRTEWPAGTPQSAAALRPVPWLARPRAAPWPPAPAAHPPGHSGGAAQRAGKRESTTSWSIEGTSSGDLLKGPGHLPSTPLPGQGGEAVLVGKSTTAGAPFADVARLRRGDVVTVRTGQGLFHFSVQGRLPPGARQGAIPSDRGRLVLVTSGGSGGTGGLEPSHDARRGRHVEGQGSDGTATPAALRCACRRARPDGPWRLAFRRTVAGRPCDCHCARVVAVGPVGHPARLDRGRPRTPGAPLGSEQ